MKATPDEMNKAFKRYNSIVDSIPDYINKNLQEMPSNKGYIWKQVHLYGLRPPEKPFNKTVLFEKLPRQVTRIHEWANNCYRIYRKEGREIKTLESSQQRVKKRFKKYEPPTIDAAFPALNDSKNNTQPNKAVKLWEDFNPHQEKEEVEMKSEALHTHSSFVTIKRRK